MIKKHHIEKITLLGVNQRGSNDDSVLDLKAEEALDPTAPGSAMSKTFPHMEVDEMKPIILYKISRERAVTSRIEANALIRAGWRDEAWDLGKYPPPPPRKKY